MTKRLGERRVEVLLGTTALDLRLEGGRVVGVDTDQGTVDADVVVCAIDPRGLPALAPHVQRTMPAIPPVVCHLGLAGDVPDLPHEVVLHGDPTLVRAHRTAPPPTGGAAWTVLGPRPAVRGHPGRAGPARDRRPRAGRGARRPLPARPGRGAGRVGVRRALAGPRDDRPQARRRRPSRGCTPSGAHAAAGAGLPFVGLVRGRSSPRRIGPRGSVSRPSCAGRRRSRASPWSGSACRSAARAPRRRAARRTSRWRSRCPRRARRPGRRS